MTSQTKKYIEFSDIIGLRLECKKCGCALLLGLEKDPPTVETFLSNSNKVLSSCPTCGATWTGLPDGRLSFDSEIKDFFRRLRYVQNEESKFGCAVSLEIKNEKPLGT